MGCGEESDSPGFAGGNKEDSPSFSSGDKQEGLTEETEKSSQRDSEEGPGARSGVGYWSPGS